MAGLLTMAAFMVSILAISASPTRAAEPPILWERDVNLPVLPRGIATDPGTGDIYFAEQGAGRVAQFTIWGEFVRAFGWDVAPEEAPGDTPTDQLETCTTTCQHGAKGGSGPGQFQSPQGVALDSSGGLYVFDAMDRRLLKFDVSGPSVAFEWTIGAGVNQGPNNPGDRCTAADVAAGDTCGPGASGTGPGQFPDRSGPLGDLGSSGVGSYIATGPSDQVYVGGLDRVQRFDSDGFYLGETSVPGEVVNSLAVDNSGDLYVSYLDPTSSPPDNASKADVRKLDPATGAVLTIFPVPDLVADGGPTALAVDSSSHLFVFNRLEDANGFPLLEFDPGGSLVNAFGVRTDFFDTSGSGGSTGIATSTACGVEDPHIYVGRIPFDLDEPGFLRAYGSTPDPSLCPPPVVPPTISESFAAEVGDSSADLRAKINPHFWPDTRYRVEYGPAACSSNACVSEPLPPGALLTSDAVDADRVADVHLKGLKPNATYHYRFVAISGGGGPVFGPDQTFTTLPEPPAPNTACPNQEFRSGTPSAPLPDCRAYEMVTPLEKGDADIDSLFGNGFDADGDRPGYHYQATADGEALTYTSYRAFGDAESAAWNSQYIASRDPGTGWTSDPINVPRNATVLLLSYHQENPFLAFSEDLCSAWVAQDTDQPLGEADNAGFADIYRRGNCEEPGFSLVTTAPPLNFTAYDVDSEKSIFRVGGFSADGTRTFFTTNGQLTGNAPAGQFVFKAYVSNSGALRLVSVLPDGLPATNAFVGTPAAFNTIENLRAYDDNLDNAVSEDGSRVYWTSEEGLYLRLNPERSQSPLSEGACTDPTRACTLPVSGTVSASETVSVDNARFWKATPDGSKALFTALVKTEIGEDEFESFTGLYSYDLATRSSTLIAEGVKGLAGASDDLSRVYFVSEDVLDSGAGAGKDNLYFWEQGGGARFIATLAADNPPSGATWSPTAWNSKAAERRARVTPDGGHLAFLSRTSLSGYDNTDPNSGKPASEIFLYDAEADELRCVSCPRSDARPAARMLDKDEGTGVGAYAADARIPGWMSGLYPGNPLSTDGNRLFFQSFSRLLAADVNGKQDVYQWEAEGSGDCEATSSAFDPKAGGCISLISSGQSPDDSSFVDASADGRDVFFRTRDQLHPADTDELLDIYDARAGGGLPAPAPKAPPCEGDLCQGEPSTAPANPGAGTSVFEGPPNERQGQGPCARIAKEVRRALAIARKAPNSKRARKLRRQAGALKRKAARCQRRERR